MNTQQLRSMRFEASILGLDRVAFQLDMALAHPDSRTYHVMEAIELVNDDLLFGTDLASRLKVLVYGQRKLVLA